MKLFSLVMLSAISFPGVASAAYVCELYDRAAEAPGGDVPAAVFYSNTTDSAQAEAACRAKLNRVLYIDFWLKWIEDSKLPANWRQSDLLEGASVPAPQPNPIPEPATATKRGYECRIYDKPADAPQGDAPFRIFLTDIMDVNGVTERCKSVMRSSLPNGYRDFEVRYLEALPEGWSTIDLFR